MVRDISGFGLVDVSGLSGSTDVSSGSHIEIDFLNRAALPLERKPFDYLPCPGLAPLKWLNYVAGQKGILLYHRYPHYLIPTMAPSQPDNAPTAPVNNEQRQSQQEDMQEIALQPMTSLPMSLAAGSEMFRPWLASSFEAP
ncbi:hypothetical protein CIB48_g2714 [Xylaria polymorpha]|nr:hypothetical protein CIB48_g2714 [Xylaria polymorpha]